MRLLLAIFLPWLQFFTIGRPFAGVICLILQITIIGWLPASIWSVYALSQYKTDRKIAKALGGEGVVEQRVLCRSCAKPSIVQELIGSLSAFDFCFCHRRPASWVIL